MPGARPTMSNRAFGSPNGGTGPQKYSGSFSRTASRNEVSRGQSRHLGSKMLFIVGRVAIHNGAQEKTGYAETPRSPPSITRGFGLTRAQPNLRPEPGG